MTRLFLLSCGLVSLILAGCGSSEPDEAKLRRDLSHPPSMAGVGQHQHKGANVRAPMNGQPATTGTTGATGAQ